MINMLVLYSLLIGGWQLFYHHGRTVVPGKESNGLRLVGRWVFRMWVLTFMVILGSSDIPGKGYWLWFETYSLDHSMIVWTFTTLPFTVVLWVVKAATYQTRSRPGHYAMFGANVPSLTKVSMGLPAGWSVVFWAWMLLSPSLPFWTCFVRIFLLKTPVDTIFPLS